MSRMRETEFFTRSNCPCSTHAFTLVWVQHRGGGAGVDGDGHGDGHGDGQGGGERRGEEEDTHVAHDSVLQT